MDLTVLRKSQQKEQNWEVSAFFNIFWRSWSNKSDKNLDF